MKCLQVRFVVELFIPDIMLILVVHHICFRRHLKLLLDIPNISSGRQN
ncbi:Uncharacterized protein APZ42_032250 [Daphnia magna]|uniref:Uncharacterized protein n=1 Tax=Daphnia magna TaxID=35525 RepID=A0A164M529_9CRUS|nr:Uncharacterized protein APZ42_032250 [Daphnia magna]